MGSTLLGNVIDLLNNAQVDIFTRDNTPELNELEVELEDAYDLTTLINAKEWRWPLNVLRDRGANFLSQHAVELGEWSEKITSEEYADALRSREALRETHSNVATKCEVLLTLSAPGCAPASLDWTGDPIFAVNASILGAPALSLPLLESNGLPLGLQIIGFRQKDAETFALAAWVNGIVESMNQ